MLRLKKALYGAPRAWNQKVDTSPCDLGFTKCISEHRLYTRGVGKSRVIVGIYVDDLIIIGACAKEVEAFKGETMHLFRMSDLG